MAFKKLDPGAGVKASFKSPNVKVKGGRKKKGTNRKPGEKGLRGNSGGGGGGGSRNSPGQNASRSSSS